MTCSQTQSVPSDSHALWSRLWLTGIYLKSVHFSVLDVVLFWNSICNDDTWNPKVRPGAGTTDVRGTNGVNFLATSESAKLQTKLIVLHPD